MTGQVFNVSFDIIGVIVKKAGSCCCGEVESYEDCCGRYHSGAALPKTAEQLMRSRYSAFVHLKDEYLRDTHWPSKRSEEDPQAFLKTFRQFQWLGLEILETVRGQSQDEDGVVEFVASYHAKGPGEIRERSHFVKDGNRWYYVEGLTEPSGKLGRNDPCWCLSGKKFKKCHGRSRS